MLERLSPMVRFWTLNHAVAITGIPEEEIIAAGERQEFPYQLSTKLIIDIGGFNRWVENRRTEEMRQFFAEFQDEIRQEYVALYVKMAHLQRGLNQLEITLRRNPSHFSPKNVL